MEREAERTGGGTHRGWTWAVFQCCSRRKEKHSRQQNKTNRTHKGRKCTYILRGRKKPLLEPRNKGSSNNGGEADKSHRPQETGRITMPAECADQLRNTEKNVARRHSADRIAIIRPPPPPHQPTWPSPPLEAASWSTCLPWILHRFTQIAH